MGEVKVEPIFKVGAIRSGCAWFILLTLLFVPFLAKPVHVDDANFLVLAEGAARDPWRPHLISINWLGSTQPAFEVLSNPPGIAWWLAPVRKAPIWLLHLWMLVWLPMAIWGTRRLGRAFVDGEEDRTAMFLLTCPVVVLSAQSLLPDLAFARLCHGGGGRFRHGASARLGVGAAGRVRRAISLLRAVRGTTFDARRLAAWRMA